MTLEEKIENDLKVYFSKKFLEQLQRHMILPEMTKRYNLDGDLLPPVEDHSEYCPHCGHCLEDPDY